MSYYFEGVVPHRWSSPGLRRGLAGGFGRRDYLGGGKVIQLKCHRRLGIRVEGDNDSIFQLTVRRMLVWWGDHPTKSNARRRLERNKMKRFCLYFAPQMCKTSTQKRSPVIQDKHPQHHFTNEEEGSLQARRASLGTSVRLGKEILPQQCHCRMQRQCLRHSAAVQPAAHVEHHVQRPSWAQLRQSAALVSGRFGTLQRQLCCMQRQSCLLPAALLQLSAAVWLRDVRHRDQSAAHLKHTCGTSGSCLWNSCGATRHSELHPVHLHPSPGINPPVSTVEPIKPRFNHGSTFLMFNVDDRLLLDNSHQVIAVSENLNNIQPKLTDFYDCPPGTMETLEMSQQAEEASELRDSGNTASRVPLSVLLQLLAVQHALREPLNLNGDILDDRTHYCGIRRLSGGNVEQILFLGDVFQGENPKSEKEDFAGKTEFGILINDPGGQSFREMRHRIRVELSKSSGTPPAAIKHTLEDEGRANKYPRISVAEASLPTIRERRMRPREAPGKMSMICWDKSKSQITEAGRRFWASRGHMSDKEIATIGPQKAEIYLEVGSYAPALKYLCPLEESAAFV
ncbi:hypothetical protein B0H16DRAFT_1473673 [Mycena metata]|uniref:Uncharacterized protein n=1 Tax=Mycena metata TaxID=1033252 RepID=A0AAD7HIX1_9AGAR|nr:hypothetical protein B0H16DRAFT_1473673 [Mycena metata]